MDTATSFPPGAFAPHSGTGETHLDTQAHARRVQAAMEPRPDGPRPPGNGALTLPGSRESVGQPQVPDRVTVS